MDYTKTLRYLIFITLLFSFLYSNTAPTLSFFNGTKEWNEFGRKISFSPLENNSDDVYSLITSLSKLPVDDPKHHEIDLCLNVAKMTS